MGATSVEQLAARTVLTLVVQKAHQLAEKKAVTKVSWKAENWETKWWAQN